MNGDFLYEAPSDEVFNDIKQAAISIWNTYDDTYGYASEKVNRVEAINNVRDNWGFIIAMFDSSNQRKMFSYVELPETLALLDKLKTYQEDGRRSYE